ncbi:MAG: hypothetical protein KDD60_00060 [Bdellovibrionales bacterium]|nr:hypothetical protein [Bdellovibrionales bacterium]
MLSLVEIKRETIRLLQDDGGDSKAAEYLHEVVDNKNATPEDVMHVFSEAVREVFFTEKIIATYLNEHQDREE